jgi:phosphoesterase RecJ-like protein
MKQHAVPEELKAFFSDKSHFLLISHIDPDGDCIGSSLALGEFLKRLGKTVGYFNPGPFGRREILEFEDYFAARIPDDPPLDVESAGAVILDCSTSDRIGALYSDIRGLDVAVIDHHSTGKPFGDIRFINSSAPSTSLLVQQLIEEMGHEVTQIESEYIFFAFTTDTGFFRHLGANTQLSFQMVAKLVEAGVSPKNVYERISNGVSLESRRHLGLLLQRVQSFAEGQLLYTWENHADILEYGRANRDSDTLYEQLLKVENAEVILVLREESPGLSTGSIRTRSRIDGGKLAAEFGGGGHARAAGFTIEEGIDKLLPKIRKRIEDLLTE